MDFRKLLQFLNLRDFRNAAIGFLTVVGGLSLAGLTVWSHRTGNVKLAGIAAAASLVFVLLILVFVVPPLARNASDEAAQMDLPLDFTVGGAFMLGLVAIVGFAAWNTGNNLLFLILAFLVSVLAVSFAIGTFTVRKVDVRMRFPETVFAGERTPILLTLSNRKRFVPSFSVLLEVRGTEREKGRLADEVAKILPRRIAERITRPPVVKHVLDYFLFVPRASEVESRAEKTFPHRGRFMIRDFELSTKFPFGFFRHRRRLSASQAELVVFPSPADVGQSLSGLGLGNGSSLSYKKGHGQDLMVLRGYESGDDMRRVDWKATAKSGALTVREFSSEDDRRVTVALETRVVPADGERPRTLRERLEAERSGKPSEPESPAFEHGVSTAAGLLVRFAEEGAEIRLLIDSEDGGFGSGKSHLQQCLRRLSLVEPRLGDDVEGAGIDSALLAQCAAAGNVFFIGSRADAELPPDVFLIGY
jgi:uncharacterized protein (DUF58 family)